jgi:hypothetical protein
MELIYKGSFRRDTNSIANKELMKALKRKIDEIKSANSVSQISRLKRFRARNKIWYKIEIHTAQGNKIYWILCIIRNNVVEFRRLKPESYFKKNF